MQLESSLTNSYWLSQAQIDDAKVVLDAAIADSLNSWREAVIALINLIHPAADFVVELINQTLDDIGHSLEHAINNDLYSVVGSKFDKIYEEYRASLSDKL